MEGTSEFPTIDDDMVEADDGGDDVVVTEVEDVEIDEAETERMMDEEPDEDGGVEEDDE